mmetsp:Transcript_11330/g.51401  ORF Transcript_11330/g.51401 Transcript_11330/m.51401 type:complete len:218 (-) Transcript_11330:1108-1761(-)
MLINSLDDASLLPVLGGHEHPDEPLPGHDRHDDRHRTLEQVHTFPDPRGRRQRHHQPSDSEQRDGEEMRHQRQRVRLQPAEQRDGPRGHAPTEPEVLETRASHLLHGTVLARAEDFIQRVGEGVDGERRSGSMGVKGVDAFAHGGGVREGRQRRQHGLHGHDVAERDGHAAARQRVSHVERVAEEDGAGGPRRLRRHRLVHHRLERAAAHGARERVP